MGCTQQVLTGVVPYDGDRGHYSLLVRIKSGERPPRPTNPEGVRWLQDKIWGMITTCWSEDPNQRWEVSAMCDLLSASSLQEVQKVKSGNRTFLKTSGNRVVTEGFQTSKQGGAGAPVQDYVRGSPPFSNFCWFQNQKSRGS